MEDNVFYKAGQVVTLRQDIPNKPVMLVVGKATSVFKHDREGYPTGRSTFIGIKCRWFTTSGEMQEAIFSTKDLELVEDNNLNY